MSSEAQDKLLSLLGCNHVLMPEHASGSFIDAGPGLTESFIKGIDNLLIQVNGPDPDTVIDMAPLYLGERPNVQLCRDLLIKGRQHLDDPEPIIAAVMEAEGEPDDDLPTEDRFNGYDPAEIIVNRHIKRFESSDPSWVLTWIEAWMYRLTRAKPTLPSFDTDSFRYKLPDTDSRVALFSDWANGYYHSRYIAKCIGGMQPDAAIHLGDVYYTGREHEVHNYMERPVNQYITGRDVPFFTLNANHEMDSWGIPFFKYLKKSHADNPALYPQESSMFCIYNQRIQLIAIDTAYDKPGRFINTRDKQWLAYQLESGRSMGAINILLSQHEAIRQNGKDVADLFESDLKEFDQYIDLWFWGDQHYCALYAPGRRTHFYGSCIGHGGYPYPRIKNSDLDCGFSDVLWVEESSRYSLRPDRGNNGFCLLESKPGAIELRYIDWRTQIRCDVRIDIRNGMLEPRPAHVTQY